MPNTLEENLDYVLNIFKTNKMDMKYSTIKELLPEKMESEINHLLITLVQNGFLSYSDSWWSSTLKGRNFSGFTENQESFENISIKSLKNL